MIHIYIAYPCHKRISIRRDAPSLPTMRITVKPSESGRGRVLARVELQPADV